MSSDQTSPRHLDLDPRESMRRLGRWAQPLLTALTGKPLHDERQRMRWTPWQRLASTLTVLASSTAVSVGLLHGGRTGWVLLPATWLLTAGAARTLQTTFVHHASHGALSPRPWLNRATGELLSTLALIQPLSLYKRDHMIHHARLATADDADLRFLVSIGMKPGLTIAAYRRWIVRTALSPRFHLQYLRARLAANFVEAPWMRRVGALLYWAALLAIAVHAGALVELLLAWLLPVILLFQVAGLYQVVSEHRWVRNDRGAQRIQIALSQQTSARFMGEPAPAPGLPLLRAVQAWSRWVAAMIFVHSVARIFVVTADLAQHDEHHRSPRTDWANAAYARRAATARAPGRWGVYTEIWGLAASLDATFAVLGSLPSSARLGEPATYTCKERSHTMLAM